MVLRETAVQDVDQAVAYLLQEATPSVAEDFVDALEAALAHISSHPQTGSPRFAHALDLPGLRAWTLNRFPYTVFFCECHDRIDVWRVLHQRRDFAAWLNEDE